MTSSQRKLSPAVLLAALGVVYGDIGTSPLYAFKESLTGEHGAGVTPDDVYGVLSMIFWAITLVVSIKYVLLVLRADNDGEGGILALLALVLRQLPAAGRLRTAAIGAGLVGAAMFYGDSVITPAISVLSAIEGLQVVSAAFAPWVVPLTLVVLVALFAVQNKGTATRRADVRPHHGGLVRRAWRARPGADRARTAGVARARPFVCAALMQPRSQVKLLS